jgi:hypothetical protein
VVIVWWIVVRKMALIWALKFFTFSNFIFGRTSSMMWAARPSYHGSRTTK